MQGEGREGGREKGVRREEGGGRREGGRKGGWVDESVKSGEREVSMLPNVLACCSKRSDFSNSSLTISLEWCSCCDSGGSGKCRWQQ